jgi:YidC/Oxa1 family membrane protein insertase
MLLVPANIFQPLIDVFEAVLKFFHNSLGVPWGWAIVLLTVVVRACLLPLTIRQFHSMQKMQQLAPQMKAIQGKYKEDKQRQQQEMMKFYKENDVHPLGSCLPLVAQLPVFISLFYMLRTSLRVDICPDIQRAANHGVLSTAHTVPCGPNHGAEFLFIPDLTNKATGAVLVVLIVLYIGTQLASSLMMSSPTMDPTQRKIMLFMPLFFVLFVINFPAGVILYWITTNTWTMGQQYVIRRRIGPTQAPPVAATAASGATSVVPTTGGAGQDQAKQPKKATTAPAADGNGLAGLGGLGGLLRGHSKTAENEKAAVGTKSGPPPRPPRKKKKRSGRRR